MDQQAAVIVDDAPDVVPAPSPDEEVGQVRLGATANAQNQLVGIFKGDTVSALRAEWPAMIAYVIR